MIARKVKKCPTSGLGFVVAAVILLSGCMPRLAREAGCGRVKGAGTWAFCMSGPRSGGDILYYLHGAGGSEHTWWSRDMYARRIEREWSDAAYSTPTVVGISLGPRWVLNPQREAEVAETVIPAIEARLGMAPQHRFLIGESMGGFNVIQLSMRHPALFSKVAVLCPGIMKLSPSAPLEDVLAFVARTGANRRRVETALQLLRSEFPTAETWAEASPLLVGERLLGPQSPALYISCGTKDEFGFFEGAKIFSELARAKGVSIVWDPVQGGHCSVAPQSVAHFFSKG